MLAVDPSNPIAEEHVARVLGRRLVGTRAARDLHGLRRAVLEQSTLARDGTSAVTEGKMRKVLVELDDVLIVHEFGYEHRFVLAVCNPAVVGLVVEAV